MIWHAETLKAVIDELDVDMSTGLSDEQVKKRLDEYGENKLQGKKKKSLAVRFFEQFKDVMVIILLLAAVISFIVAITGHDKSEFLEPVIIVGIVVLNAVLGLVQESKAQKALDALKNMSAPHAKVMRNRNVQVVDASTLVPGDVIYVEAGDFIPADGRLIESASLKCEESAMTGESVPVEKDYSAKASHTAPIGDRVNMIYSGCSVSYGRGIAVVTATGMNTEMGKIAGLLNNEDEDTTPLQQKLAQMGKYLGFLALAICAVIFAIGLLNKMPVMSIFMTSVSLAVAAIPEGLPAIVTIVLALGVQRMVKKNAIIRRLPAVETLGSASVICSDKTGTLTQNRMTLSYAWVNGEPVAVNENAPEDIRALIKLAALCCDGEVIVEEGKEKHIGDPTETAIIKAALINSMPKKDINAESPRVAEIPFDSDRKMMTTVNVVSERPIAIVKGAFDVIMSRCTAGNIEEAYKINEAMGRRALRVLAVAYRELDSIPVEPKSEEIENSLTFLGLLGIIDPPREEAKAAVATCISAGIKPVMITGDHVVTASAIAKELGILKDEKEAISGAELAQMSEEELNKNIRNYSVYARVSPEDKIRIVKAWQNAGEIVSMTGDGVNDAPALKAADIGCAMGITGTDVAKGAADMILTDDNFATIVDAVSEGRGIYDNIKKAVQFLLSCNVGEVLAVLISMLLWHTSPLLAIQLLWLNLVTDGLPALALGVEPVEKDIMDRKPKPKDEGIFANGMPYVIVLQGLMFALLTVLGYYIGKTVGSTEAAARTMAFLVLAQSQLFHAFNARSEHSVFKVGLLSNKYMLGAFAVSLVLVLLIALIPPVAAVFGMVILPAKLYVAAITLSVSPLVIVEVAKLLIGLFKKK